MLVKNVFARLYQRDAIGFYFLDCIFRFIFDKLHEYDIFISVWHQKVWFRDLVPEPQCLSHLCYRLNRCDLTAKSCVGLASSILKSSSSNLTVLDLSHNDIKDAGVEKIAESLRSKCCRLEVLK